MSVTDWSSMSPVKLALLADQLRSQSSDSDALAAEPIAVVGIGCRYPGGANTPEAYWELIRDGVDAISEVPADRWDADEFYDADGYTPGKMNTRWGGFVDGIDQFDAAHFAISPREAARMDPQQRMMLEVAVEALERAGQPIDGLAGSLTGVFVGSSMLDYGEREHAGALDIDAYSVTGNVHCIIANRLSYVLDVHGPSVSIDTACSSSLVAVHLACQSLRSRDSNLAIAGGVNALLSPNATVALAKWGLMAPDGRCKTLDAKADGFVRSEGCGVVVLKRLSDAIAANDPVVAVIRGSAVNQDGRSTAMTAPNGLAQQDVIRRALHTARVRAEQVGFVELHGTGTVLGDPIEVEAIAEVLGAETGGNPLMLGAVKTNIGHLEAGSGIAGLIKSVLCLQHESIPPPVHFETLNPHISLDGTRLCIPTDTHPWPRGETRRIAGVSSFGFGGTNAHVLVEEAPALPMPAPAGGLPLLVLSAPTPEALHDTALAMADHLDSGQAGELTNICATAALRRTHHAQRLAVVGSEAADVVERLRSVAAGERNPSVVAGRLEPGERRRVAFVCAGQGNQWWAMARDLLTDDPTFRAVVERCDELLRDHVSWSLLEELARSEADTRLERTEFAQPAIFAVQAGLAALWRTWGVVPDAIVGHSVGEVTAAYLSGALSLEDAVRVIAARGESMKDTFGTGSMASIELSVDEVRSLIAEFGDRVSVAAINAPDVTVISGQADAVARVVALVQANGDSVRPLEVTYPFHSSQMNECGAALEHALTGLQPTKPSVRFASTVTGAVEDEAILDAKYWSANVTDPVRFSQAIGRLHETGCDTFVELGPHPVLGGAIRRTIAASTTSDEPPVIVASLRRGRAGLETMAAALGELHCNGVAVDWSAVWPGRRTVSSLPTSRWQHRRHWAENWQPAGGLTPSTPTRPGSSAQQSSPHPLVGARLRSPAIDGYVYESWLSPDAPSFLGDHRVGDVALVPGTGFVEMSVAAFAAATSQAARTVEDLNLLGALALADDGTHTPVQVHVQGDVDRATVVVASDDGAAWTEHARCRVSGDQQSSTPTDIEAVRARCDRRISGAELYAGLRARHINFGASFLGVNEAWLGTDEAIARLTAPVEVGESMNSYVFHPAWLDAAVHTLAALLPDDGTAYLPVAIGAIHFHDAPGTELWAHLRVNDGGNDSIVTVDVSIVDPSGTAVVDLIGLRAARVDTESIRAGLGRRGPASAGAEHGDLLYGIEWQKLPVVAEAVVSGGPWLIVSDQGGLGDELAARLRELDVQCDLVTPDEELTADLVRSHLQTTAATEVVYLRGADNSADTDPVAAQERRLGGALAVTRALGESPARLWLVTVGAHRVAGESPVPEQAPLSGFGAAVAAERPDAACVRIDLDSSASVADSASSLMALLTGRSSSAIDDELVAVRDAHSFVARLVPLDAGPKLVATGPTRMMSSSYGVLDGLHDGPMERTAPGPNDVEIEVEVTGLNFRDVLVALDMYPERSDVFGDECVGVVVRAGDAVTNVQIGDRVVAFAPGSFASHVTTRAELAHRVSDTLGSNDAATIPMTFLTAHYALSMLGNLAAGERVLIHAGAGGVGMAAIQLAQRLGAEVFATAGTDDKRATLTALGVDHVFDSRSLDFADGVLAATGGAGVDVVLNSLADDFIQRSVDVVATGGRFLEIGRRDVWTTERMATERPDIGYHIVFLGDLTVGDPPSIQMMFRELLPLFESGELTPLPCTAYESDAVVDAFRLMAQARHTGKIVVRRSRGAVSADGTYLVTGGTGGIGLLIARHLVELGAGSIALVSRGPANESVMETVAELRAAGADVELFQADVSVRADIADVIDRIGATMRPLRGVVHAAGVTDDALLDKQTWSNFQRTLAPKIGGAVYLHELTAHLGLDLFVMMSAASTLIGAPGQVNYVAANAFLDAFAAARTAAGDPSLSIGWGAWDRVGMTEHIDDGARNRMARRGIRALSVTEGLAAFDAASRAAVSGRPHVLAMALDRTQLQDRPVWAELRIAAETGAETSLFEQWADAVPVMRRSAIAGFVEAQARKVLGLSSSLAIPPRQPLSEVGLDSLMAVELRNAIGTALGEPQPATLLFDHPTSAALVEYLFAAVDSKTLDKTQSSANRVDSSSMSEPAVSAADLDQLAEMTEDEAEALLLAELGSPERDS